ncbi:DEAD/DEAH box helicase [Paenibacillus agaridevorans]|uniref:DEAD/DEAH box helicase n=1 Tax=Paenibacillus agaridevorans TaxID=171404 RepID=UPI001BE42DFA|nr:DEAD/DEAH box helicase [Paenibacillus agaridevorans]
MSTTFSSLGITPELTALLKEQGIAAPTPVQRQTIPMLLQDKDVIAQAQTGTGKTLAFALPMLQRVNVEKEQVQALILTPTRELAIQITSEIKKLAPVVGARVLAAYGGQDVDAQIRKLQRSPHIVVATPGRLIDHMTRGTINLGKLSMLVLDEADQMLHMGFLPEVESIIAQTPRARQTMLFSATMPDAIRKLAAEYMNAPEDVQIRSANVTLDNIRQLVIETTDRGKQQALIHLLEQHRPYLAVIFCRTKVRAKKLNKELQDAGFESDELHGDLTQAKREQVMKRFRDAKLQMLVATDVAARGLDVEGVTHVYNYDVPQDSEIYIHRIGRTGRAGHKGMAITLATPYDGSKLVLIEKGIQARLEHKAIDREGSVTESSRARSGGERGEAAGRKSSERSGGRSGRGGRDGGRGVASGGRGGRGRGAEQGSARGSAAGKTRGTGGGRERDAEARRGSSGRGEDRRSGSGRAAVAGSTDEFSSNPWEAGRDSSDKRVSGRGGNNERGGRNDSGRNAGGPGKAGGERGGKRNTALSARSGQGTDSSRRGVGRPSGGTGGRGGSRGVKSPGGPGGRSGKPGGRGR